MQGFPKLITSGPQDDSQTRARMTFWPCGAPVRVIPPLSPYAKKMHPGFFKEGLLISMPIPQEMESLYSVRKLVPGELTPLSSAQLLREISPGRWDEPRSTVPFIER